MFSRPRQGLTGLTYSVGAHVRDAGDAGNLGPVLKWRGNHRKLNCGRTMMGGRYIIHVRNC